MNPSVEVRYYSSIELKYTETWKLDGKIHRSDGPAFIEYYPDGNLKREDWKIHGDFCRSDGPAYIQYYSNGQAKIQEWIFNNLAHRSDGPAYIHYHEDGIIKHFRWYKDGRDINDQILEYMRENELVDPLNIPLEHQLIIKMKFF